MEEKRVWLEPRPGQLRRRRQWAWRGLMRSSLYDPPAPVRAEERPRLRLLDEPYTATPL